jgi:hypothetical protein
MAWTVVFFPDFEREFDIMSSSVQDGLFARLIMLEREGPSLGRPHADTLIGSQHANMKELRYSADGGVWRIAFAFDTQRKAVLLVAGDKAGRSEKRFYRKLITKADERFNHHLLEKKDT